VWRLAIPERRLTSGTGDARRAPAVRQALSVVLQVDAGLPVVRVGIVGDNDTTDVRIRIGFRSGLRSPRVVADAAFGPVERGPVAAASTARETPPRTAPLHRYVSVFGADRGATVFSDGLAEYEAGDDGIVWITLLRSVGELSRHDLPERPGHAGYPVPTPQAQCLGPFEAAFGFALHGPASSQTTALIERLAEDTLAPLRGWTWRTAIAPPHRVDGPELSGEGLGYSAVKTSEDGAWMVLRCVNLVDQTGAGSWRLPGITEAVRSRLDETPGEALPVDDGVVRFVARGREVVTILVR
jgi:alpha-mannosidase